MKSTLIAALVFGIATFCNASVISEIMKKYHKGDTALTKKVQAGKGSDVDLAVLLKAYKDMAAAKPPKGDQSSWDTKCKALIVSIEAFQKKDNNAVSKYKLAVACKSCHEVHKK